MSNLKNEDRKELLAIPDTVKLTTEQRVEFLANLIIERILDDKANGHPLLKRIEESTQNA